MPINRSPRWQALQAVTERIARQNPEINAFVMMNPARLQAARDSTARWQAGSRKACWMACR